MHEHWEHKKRRSAAMSNPQIDEWYELGRRYGGEEEAYRIALEDDDQVKSAAALFDKAPTLPKLLALASEMNKGKQTTQVPLNTKSVR